jgi:hypothetical protein
VPPSRDRTRASVSTSRPPNVNVIAGATSTT